MSDNVVGDVPVPYKPQLPEVLGGPVRQRGLRVAPDRIKLRVPAMTMMRDVDREQIERGWRPGFFRVGPQAWEKPVVVFLLAQDVRRYDVEVNKKQETLCASPDGMTPWGRIAKPYCDECTRFTTGTQGGIRREDVCPMARWDRTVTPNKPPACSSGFAFFGLLIEAGNLPFWFPLMSTRESVARKFLRDFKQGTAQDLWQLRVRLSAVEAGTGAHKWWVPKFDVLNADNPDPTEAFEAAGVFAQDFVYAPYMKNDLLRTGGDDERVVPESAEHDEGVDGIPGSDAPHSADDDDIPF